MTEPLAERCPHAEQVATIRRRLQLNRLFALVAVAAVLCTTSYWRERQLDVVASAMVACGIALAVLGSLGRLWAQCHIGGRKKRQVVTAGPYAMCRHPLYLSSLIGGIGVGLCTARLSIPLVYLLISLLLLPGAMRKEEEFLGHQFPEYALYRPTVPALFPRLRGLRLASPARIERRAVLREALHAVAVLALVGGMQVVERLQVADVLPVFLTVP
jgi:protein-S-isoprenylcysteine O-methyltransferase Ste14